MEHSSGCGLGLGKHQQRPVSKVSLGAMGLWGDNVKGWSFLFGYKF